MVPYFFGLWIVLLDLNFPGMNFVVVYRPAEGNPPPGWANQTVSATGSNPGPKASIGLRVQVSPKIAA
jgi:hypothetical protein